MENLGVFWLTGGGTARDDWRDAGPSVRLRRIDSLRDFASLNISVVGFVGERCCGES